MSLVGLTCGWGWKRRAAKIDKVHSVHFPKRSATRRRMTTGSRGWGGIWISHYVLAALHEGKPSPEQNTNATEAVRVSRRMTDLRPDWGTGWHRRAASDVLAAIHALNRGKLASGATFLRDAMQSLDHLKAMGNVSTAVQEMRLQTLMLMQMERLEGGDEAQYRQLAADVAELVSDLQGRGVSLADSAHAGLAYVMKLQEAEHFRKREEWDRAVTVLTQALPLVARHGDMDPEQRAIWLLEDWRIHVLLAEAYENAGPLRPAASLCMPNDSFFDAFAKLFLNG